MSFLTCWPARRPVAPSASDRNGLRDAPDDSLTCMLGFSAAGLFASCVALSMQHESQQVALLELVLICAAAPLAALAGLFMIRRPR